MRFLASKVPDSSKAETKVTASGTALGSIPAARPIIVDSISSSRSRNSMGNFMYRSMFTPPSVKQKDSPVVDKGGISRCASFLGILVFDLFFSYLNNSLFFRVGFYF